MKFIIVVHGWHTSSNGFDVHHVEAKDEKEAENIGHMHVGKRASTFDTCAMVVIPIESQ